MKYSILYERDFLYPTNNRLEPGSVRIKVLSPNKRTKIPIIIEKRSEHDPSEFFDSILKIMQSEIFDRIRIDLKLNTEIYISRGDKAKGEFMKAVFAGDSVDFEEADFSDIEA
jgi:hypothetical protein